MCAKWHVRESGFSFAFLSFISKQIPLVRYILCVCVCHTFICDFFLSHFSIVACLDGLRLNHDYKFVGKFLCVCFRCTLDSLHPHTHFAHCFCIYFLKCCFLFCALFPNYFPFQKIFHFCAHIVCL